MTITPCPFCTATAGFALFIPVGDSGNGTCVFCPVCLAHGPVEKDEADALAAWNRRAPMKLEIKWPEVVFVPPDDSHLDMVQKIATNIAILKCMKAVQAALEKMDKPKTEKDKHGGFPGAGAEV